jgi:thiol:disulfide interchange protein DsbD
VTLSFLLIGLSLSVLRNAGALIGWGFQLQSPSFILFLVWLFFLLVMQLLGLYEIGWINGNVGGKWARREGNVGAFFTGVLAVVVASPCTAPFMGVALGFALSQSTPILLAVFICMGLGLSFPYVLFGVFPSWSRILPKPGVWMLRFKQVMAVPLLLTCVWLTWLLLQLKGEKGVGLAIAGMIALFLCVWIKTKKWQVPVAFGFLVLAGGVAAVRALPDVQAEARASELNWEPFQESQMTWEQGPTIFIDFTADWCLTCKVNERLVFDRKDIVQFLKTNHVRLLKGDWTRQDPAITQFLSKYQRAGVPFYIAFGPKAPQGKILPEVLTPEVFKREMQAVMDVKEGDR